MSSDVGVYLGRIETELAELERSTLLRLLRPGVASTRVREVLSSCGLPSAVDLEVLYGWRNGTDTERGCELGDIYLLPGFYLLSVEDAATYRRAFLADPRWEPGWWPLLFDGGGDFYVFELVDGTGAVRRFRNGEEEHPVEFESIGRLLTTLVAGFDRGIFYVDQNGYLEMDDVSFGELATALNPRVSWWHDARND